MKSTLTTLAVICALAWGGLHAWRAYSNVSPLTRAEWAMGSGDYETAIAFYEEAETLQPGNLRIRVQLAECHDRLGDKATAAALYKQARVVLNDPDAPASIEYHRDRLATLESLGY